MDSNKFLFLFCSGPAEKQTLVPTDDDNDLVKESGFVSKDYTPFISNDDVELLKELKMASAGNMTPRINWPTIHSDAISIR